MMTMTISDAQADLRRAYAGGGPGAVISGLVWFVAAYAANDLTTADSFAVLFIGGMFIFPLSAAFNRFVLKRTKESADNPFGMLVLEVTILMIALFFAAWLMLPYNQDLVFPLCAIAVGAHYLAFKTAYGMKVYWVLGAAVTLLGFAAIYQFVPLPGGMVVLVGLVEITFGLLITAKALSSGTGS